VSSNHIEAILLTLFVQISNLDDMDRFDERISLLRKELRTYGQEICSNIFYINSNEKHGSLSLKEDPIKVLQVLHQDISDLLDCSKTRSDNVLKVTNFTFQNDS
jgi:hypothetical protein